LPSKLSEKKFAGVGLGAAFLMATSAIGPGFLTQTTLFTQQLLASFGFVILISILLDIGAQLNTWRILTMSELRAQQLADKVLSGLGISLSVLVALGGLAFNIGNIAGCGLAINVLTGIDVKYGAVISCVLSLGIFWTKEAGKAMDIFTKLLGILMVGLTIYVAVSSHPPMGEVLRKTFMPDKIDTIKIVTLVGGTVGGYISFAGAHRLLDAGITGKANLPEVNKSAVSGIVLTGIMRVVLFLAALGVIIKGFTVDASNPAASVFKQAAGQTGYYFFGVVMWSAAITSVVGAAYTSVSFVKSFHLVLEKNSRTVISVFIVFSTLVFLFVGQPVKLLVLAGMVNGFILPIALAVMLIASSRPIFKNYHHPLWLKIAGWIIVVAMTWMSVIALNI
jgi:Mn2+/Fe2+ NRAMP family transporter